MTIHLARKPCVGAKFSQEGLGVTLGPYKLMENGQPLEFDADKASEYLKDTTDVHATVQIEVRIGKGSHEGMSWGCDLSYDYVKINAEYTT
jgi:glutamate N-acetyltransferase / amino-acid N-acetyltransferase